MNGFNTRLKKKLKICLLLAGILLSISAYGQQIAITGTVVDENNEGLPGVNVLIKGTTQGVVTNIDGKFSINVPNANTILQISFIGYNTQEITVGDQRAINVILTEASTELDEVVVVGYGTVKKKDVTGSIATIKSDVLVQAPVANVAQAMAGRMAGVSVTTTDGAPDAEIMIRVRGGGSITQDNTPLYIVDGFPVSSFSHIPSGDIEDITVLKDASSTAIYGAQGANGVVLVTTKKPQEGRVSVTYNGFLQSKKLSKHMDIMDPYEYVKFNYELAAFEGTSALASFQRRFGHYEDMDLYKYQKGTDWQDDMFGNDVLSQQHSISIAGGSGKTRVLASGTYNKDGGLMPYSDYTRYNLSFKLDQEIVKGLKFTFNSRVTDTETNGDGSSGGTYKVRTFDAVSRGPVGALGDVDIDPNLMTEEEIEQWQKDNMSYAQRLYERWKRKNSRTYAFDAALDWKIITGLSYRLEGGYTYGFNEDKAYKGYTTTEATNNGGKPLVEWTKENAARWRVLNMLTYEFMPADKHKFNVMVGQEVSSIGGNSNKITAKGFNRDLSPEKIFANLGLGDGGAEIGSSVTEPNNMVSFFGRINYNYGERYLATFTLRGDGSSRFAPGNQWGYFPSAAVAWRIVEEPFMKSVGTWLSDLKLRASYGEAGNNRIKASMFKLNYKISSSGTYAIGDTPNNYYTLVNAQLANPHIQWESMVTRNFGLDFGLFKHRLSGSVEYYWNTSKDLLLEARITAPGYTSMMQNIGQTTNKGVEITLNGQIVQNKNFSLAANFNISFNKSNIDALNADGADQYYATGWASTDLKPSNSGGEYKVSVGGPLGIICGLVTDGYYTTADFEGYDETAKKFIPKAGVPHNSFAGGRIGIRPGTIKFKDVAGDDGVVDEKDVVQIGNTNPKFQGGFGFNGTFLKNFDFMLNFAFVYGNDIYNANKAIMTQQYRTSYPNLLDYMNSSGRYTYLADDGSLITDLATLAAMNEGANAKEYWSPLSFGNANAVIHSWLIEDGSFLRLQNVTLGYTLPQTLSSKVAIERLRVYCTLNNVFVLTNYSGYDPEVSSEGRGSVPKQMIPGLDYSGYPKSFSWTVGLNVTF